MTTIKTLEELGRALDNGERVDRSTNENGLFWAPLSAHFDMPLNWYMEQIEAGNLRIAPKMTFIEGKGGRFEYPEPLSGKVEDIGHHYFWFNLVTLSVQEVPNAYGKIEHIRLRARLVHTTKEAAEQHLEAYRKAMGVDDE